MKNIKSHKDILFFSYEDLCENTTNTINKIKLHINTLDDINTNQKFNAHNFKTKKSMHITNLNYEKINKIQQKDLLIINKYFRESKDVLDFLGDSGPKKTKSKKESKPIEKPKPKTSVSFIKCPKCKIPVEKKCDKCGFKNPLYR